MSKHFVYLTFNYREQIDLIDMQTLCYNDFRFILNNQDHLKKSVLLRQNALKKLQSIHKISLKRLGHHSDNGREFVNAIITILNEMWETNIFHGISDDSPD